MTTLSQGSAPNIVSANIISEDRIVALTAQIYDSSALTANTATTRTYTVVSATTTPTTGQIAVSGLVLGDIIIGVAPASTGSTITSTAQACSASLVAANTVAMIWNNTAATAPTSAAGPIQILVYRPSYINPKTTFEG